MGSSSSDSTCDGMGMPAFLAYRLICLNATFALAFAFVRSLLAGIELFSLINLTAFFLSRYQIQYSLFGLSKRRARAL